MTAPATRATALPPEQRRRAIAEATLALLLDKGPAVTTRQIAEAAGIAEGTIFRAFADKDAVLRAAVELAFDTEPVERALAGIDRGHPLDRQLVEAVGIIQERLHVLWRLFQAVGDALALHHDHGRKGPPELAALAALFEPHEADLRHAPAVAARELQALTLAVSHPALFGDVPMSPPEVVSLLLHGIRKGTAGAC